MSIFAFLNGQVGIKTTTELAVKSAMGEVTRHRTAAGNMLGVRIACGGEAYEAWVKDDQSDDIGGVYATLRWWMKTVAHWNLGQKTWPVRKFISVFLGRSRKALRYKRTMIFFFSY